MANKNTLFKESYYSSLATRIENQLKKEKDIKHFEIITSSSKSLSISFEEGYIKNSKESIGKGIGIRLIGDEGKEGMAYTSDISDSKIERVIREALSILNAAPANPEFVNLAFPAKSYDTPVGIFDAELQNLSLEQITELTEPIFQLRSKPTQPKISGDFGTGVSSFFIKNSNGVENWELSSSAGVSSNITLPDPDSPSNGFDWDTVCNLKDLDVAKVARKSYEMAEKGLQKKKVPTAKYDVILSPSAVTQLLLGPLCSAINSESIQNQMSFLGSKVDQKIGSDLFNIVDDPFIPAKISTESFDGEGTKTQKLDIVKGGVLENIYYNTFTANKVGKESNGHGSRGSYASSVGISSHNIIMLPGNISKDNMIGAVKNGIYFEYTGDSPNLVTGDFSGLIMVGYHILDGEIKEALLETMIGVNLLDAFNKISEVSKERIWIEDAYVPWVKLSDIQISGSKN